ncbi:hypothetical protein IV203_004423 [Nitzschia inconspicua]|uniref:Uncharacterized protein n=1 Tax=Nitzschia inconspicua TaxID=303405 RepID=A0A9K3L411_9STRA|nr:hypothetical protein IV203_004423 [Nitzschia inconspicua]
MAPTLLEVAKEDEDFYSMDGDDSSSSAAAPLLNLRFYPTGGSDEDEDTNTVEKLLFEDIQEDEDVRFVMSGTREKVVKFADDVAEEQDAKRDKERSRKELLARIARLTDMLKNAEKAAELEKEKRKKKEKNLLKLAKEMKKRNQKREGDLERMEELEEKKRYLEHHWILAQKELDQEKALRAKTQTETQKEYEQAMKDEKARHLKAQEEQEARLTELKRCHEKQCEELGRELLKQKLEAERLFIELTSKGIDVPRRALFKEKNVSSHPNALPQFFLSTLVLMFAVLVTWGYQVDMFTKSGICSPVMPGTEFNGSTKDATFQSPWWAPESYKQEIFSRLCSGQQDENNVLPSTLAWIKDGKMNKITLTVGRKEVLKRKVVKAEVLSTKMRLWKRNDMAEEVEAVW